MDSLRHARYRAEAKANSPIMEKESPVEEKVVSSTPVMRAPSAKQGTHRAQEMVSTRCGTREVLVQCGDVLQCKMVSAWCSAVCQRDNGDARTCSQKRQRFSEASGSH